MVLRPPRTGLLAVLWWAGIIALFVMVGWYTIRRRLGARKDGGIGAARLANISQLAIWAWFLVLVVLVSAVLLAIHVVPGT